MPRLVAQRVLSRVQEDDAYSHLALDAALQQASLSAADTKLATELVYGTLTWQRALDHMLDRAVKGGTRRLDAPVLIALRVAVYQMVFLDRIPAHAAVNEAVRVTKKVGHGRAAGLVNAVLRKIARGAAKMVWWNEGHRAKKPARYLADRWSLPTWLANRLVQMYGLEQAERQAEAYTQRASLFVRARGGVDAPGEEVVGVPRARRLGGFDEEVRAGLERGDWHVQDLGSQLVGWLACASPGARVLDACAGLGGKTLHLAEQVGREGRVDAVDPAQAKLSLLEDAAHRSGLSAQVQAHAMGLEAWEASELYDVVLVDAPCTGLGTMRRHPETRWRRQEHHIARLAEQQAGLLDLAAPRVKPGGALVYSVCTFTVEEGPAQVAGFLERHPGFELDGAPRGAACGQVDWRAYLDAEGYLMLSPAEHGTDGFFAARLRRRPASEST